MNEIPASASEQMLPYIKKKKSPVAKIVLILSILAIAVGCGVTLSGKLGEGNFFSKVFGGASVSSSSETKSTDSQSSKSIYDFDSALIPEGQHGIVPMDLSAAAAGFTVSDEYGIEAAATAIIPVATNKLQVLVVNTHPFEAYTDGAQTSYGDGFSAVGGEKTVKEIARELVLALVSCGVGAEYLDTGVTAGKDSYSEAGKKISEYLSSHCDIAYIIDVHRDVIFGNDESLIRPITAMGDDVLAQMSFSVSKTSENSNGNLALAARVSSAMRQVSERILMPAEVTGASLNQNLAPLFMTVNIGTCANSFEEAALSAKLFAAAFAEAVREK